MAAVQVFWFTYDGNDRPLSSLEVGELEQLVGGSIPPPRMSCFWSLVADSEFWRKTFGS